MNKQMRLIGSFFVSVLLLGIVMELSAKEGAQTNRIVVDQNTPDEVLLAGKELENFASVKEPSERLRIQIETIEPSVEVIPSNEGEVVLKVENADSSELDVIKSTYRTISNASKIELINNTEPNADN